MQKRQRVRVRDRETKKTMFLQFSECTMWEDKGHSGTSGYIALIMSLLSSSLLPSVNITLNLLKIIKL